MVNGGDCRLPGRSTDPYICRMESIHDALQYSLHKSDAQPVIPESYQGQVMDLRLYCLLGTPTTLSVFSIASFTEPDLRDFRRHQDWGQMIWELLIVVLPLLSFNLRHNVRESYEDAMPITLARTQWPLCSFVNMYSSKKLWNVWKRERVEHGINNNRWQRAVIGDKLTLFSWDHYHIYNNVIHPTSS